MDNGIVTSYSNPDTDAVACSIVLARLLGEHWQPRLSGRISEESLFVLARCGLEPPPTGPVTAADKIALVDTHHLSQLPRDFPCQRVTLIVDHHPQGDDGAFPLARIINRPVGAAATLIAARWLECAHPDPQLCKLLAFAILSNTLHFTAPSTVPLDREIYGRLTQLAPLSREEIGQMFSQRTQVLAHGVEAALESDLKRFETGHGQLGIAQLELYDLLCLLSPEQTQAALAVLSQKHALPRLIFNGVDLRVGKSLVVCANEESRRVAEQLLAFPLPTLWQRVDHILLRKTDFLPGIHRLS